MKGKITFFFALVIILCSIYCIAFANNYTNLANRFVIDERFRNGIEWGTEQHSKYDPNKAPIQCAAYASDFATFVWDCYTYKNGSYFEGANKIKDGDVVQIHNGVNSAGDALDPHFYVVIHRYPDGRLYTAEGNRNGHVRITKDAYTINNPYGDTPKQFVVGWHNPNYEVYEEYSDHLELYCTPRGYSVDLFWTMIRNISKYRVYIQTESGSWSNYYDYGSNSYHCQLGLSEGKWIATVQAIDEDGLLQDAVTSTFELGKLDVSVNSRGPLAYASWTNFYADSYYALLVSTATGKEVFSGNVGKTTSSTFGLSDGEFVLYITAVVDGNNVKTASTTFTVDTSFEVNTYNRGLLTDATWTDYGADSYYALIVSTATNKEVFSGNIGNTTSTTFGLSDGEFVLYITAVKDGNNIGTASTRFTVDSSFVVSAVTSGTQVDVSWTDYGADSYYALAVIKDTGREVYSNNVGNTTSITFEFSEADFVIYITAVKNGQNIKTGSTVVSVKNPVAIISKTELLTQERTKLSCNVETFDSAVLRIYKEGSKYWEGIVQELEYETSFPDAGSYSAMYSFTKGTNSYNSASISWRVVENTYGVLELPEGTRRIESQAFANLTQGATVILTDEVKEIADDAFSGSTVILSVPKGSYAEEWCKNNKVPYRYE